MKNVNILSIIEAYRKLSNTLFQKLMNSYGIISGIKDYELNGIESFVNELLKIKNSITIVNNYYLGYSIPQIGKEFDLLSAYSGGYPFSISGDIRSVPS